MSEADEWSITTSAYHFNKNLPVLKQYHPGLLNRSSRGGTSRASQFHNQRKVKPRIIGLAAAVLKTVNPSKGVQVRVLCLPPFFPSCSSKVERPVDNRKTWERYLAGRPFPNKQNEREPINGHLAHVGEHLLEGQEGRVQLPSGCHFEPSRASLL